MDKEFDLKPEIKIMKKKILVGLKLEMNATDNKTGLLWRGFMMRRKEINSTDSFLYSLQKYPPDYFTFYNPETGFTKWAAAEVAEDAIVPDDMEKLIIDAGVYAVFQFKGNAENAGAFFQFIFTEWLPRSEFQLDERLHFEVLGDRYKNDDPGSEEEVWVPVKYKG